MIANASNQEKLLLSIYRTNLLAAPAIYERSESKTTALERTAS